ncbi:MAG TPA: PASTA domain-containing protein [Acidimicrobiales bacterium]|nr:PASTA domain-containing protein [Acidimicrobiales bacterium]
MAPPRIAEQIGRVLGGRYRLVAPLGTGASAHVYLADDVKLRRRVAVKVLHPALAQDDTFLRRFRAEAQQAAALRHPHVLQVFDWGEDDDGPWLVLEYLPGGSLRDMLDRGVRLSPSQALLVGVQAAQGLAYAHRRGLVHRDIKPANLLFDDEGRLVIADFGLARALAEAAWTEPAGALAGTVRYASPEQAQGSRVDGRADVYALALVLVEAVTGRVPFAADTTVATLMARVDRPIEVPAELDAMAPAIEAAGRPDPEDRAEASDLVRLLEAAAPTLPRPSPLPLAPGEAANPVVVDGDDLTILPAAAPAGDPDGAGRVFDGAAPDATGDPAGGRAARRWRRRLLLLVAVALVLGGAGVAVAATGITKPTHAVPRLAGMTLAEATREVADEDFDIRRSRTRFDEAVPAGRILEQSPLEGDELREGETVKVVVSSGPRPRDVPDLANKTAEEAKAALAELQLGYAEGPRQFHDTVEKGRVISWDPTGKLARDATVTVVLSDGKEPKEIPSFADRAYDAVRGLLENLGFVPKKEEAFDDKVEKGQVISTRPSEGERAQPGDEVLVVVSKGPELVAVPDVSGMTVTEADEKLRSVGLVASGVQGSPTKLVVASTPRAGTSVKKGSGVTLVTR